MNKTIAVISFMLITLGIFAQKQTKSYKFDGNMSEEVLRNYLARSITMAEVCVNPSLKMDGSDLSYIDDIRLIKNIGAKFIGRALFRWGGEQDLNNPEFLSFAEEAINEVHAFDGDVIFQAAIFEAVSLNVEKVAIPARVFNAFDIPAEKRNFNYNAMLFPSGKYVNQWRKGNSVPDVTQIETKFWLYFLATTYIDTGFEGIHWGQVALMGKNDPDLTHWFQIVNKIRDYAKVNARRHFILNDAHTPDGGFRKDNKLLMDFHSFPLRIKDIKDKPMKGLLEENHLDAIYNKSWGGLTASGWKCDNLPYIVEFDNFGISNHPGKANKNDHYIWGYDEISWFSLKSIKDQKEWLEYAFNWVEQTDPNGYLQMPVCRVVSNGIDKGYKYKANIKSDACPQGTGLEIKIKEIWNN